MLERFIIMMDTQPIDVVTFDLFNLPFLQGISFNMFPFAPMITKVI